MSHTSETATWGLYPWFEEHGPAMVHPDDLGRLKQLMPYGKVFLQAGEENGYLRLKYGEEEFRVKPDLFRPVPAVRFPIGSTVRIRSNGVSASVVGIEWHQRDSKPFFQLRRDGKKDSKRYFDEDLEPMQ